MLHCYPLAHNQLGELANQMKHHTSYVCCLKKYNINILPWLKLSFVLMKMHKV